MKTILATLGNSAFLGVFAELFWATKHGIRFTGMSAWGPSRSDQELWDMTAFILALPKMSAADYDALDRRIPNGFEPQK